MLWKVDEYKEIKSWYKLELPNSLLKKIKILRNYLDPNIIESTYYCCRKVGF